MVRSEDEDEDEDGGGLCWILWCTVCNALSPGGKSQGLFDVEIGQFESVSFNFSQVTGTPWARHIFLIGNKWIFIIIIFFFYLFLSFSTAPPLPPPFLFLHLPDRSSSIHFFLCSFSLWIYSQSFRGPFQCCHHNAFMLLLKLNLATVAFWKNRRARQPLKQNLTNAEYGFKSKQLSGFLCTRRVLKWIKKKKSTKRESIELKYSETRLLSVHLQQE